MFHQPGQVFLGKIQPLGLPGGQIFIKVAFGDKAARLGTLQLGNADERTDVEGDKLPGLNGHPLQEKVVETKKAHQRGGQEIVKFIAFITVFP